MLASDATISAHACALTGGGDGADGQAAGTGYSSSRRASSSRLIAEISPSSSRSRREISTRERTTSASAAGTYTRRPATCRYTYGPCGSPRVHLHPSFPQLRCCSTSAPGSSVPGLRQRGHQPVRGARAARLCRARQAPDSCVHSSHKTMTAAATEVNDITARVATGQPKPPRPDPPVPHTCSGRRRRGAAVSPRQRQHQRAQRAALTADRKPAGQLPLEQHPQPLARQRMERMGDRDEGFRNLTRRARPRSMR